MLWSDKYPDANENGSYEHGNYIYAKRADNCVMCGRLTHFVEINAGGYFCSSECDEKFYDEMFQAAMAEASR